jgi:translation initiation factor IF-3
VSDRRQRKVGSQIRSTTVRVLDVDGEHLGVMALRDALDRADDAGLQLVEISTGDPPVCRICDPGKLDYEAARAARKARAEGKGSREVRSHEVKFRPQTGAGDFSTKMRHIRRFLDAGDRVRVVVMLRGRQAHREGAADQIVERIVDEVTGVATVEGPHRAGRDVRMTLVPAS